MSYKHDMSQEKEPMRKRLLPEGQRTFVIISCEDATSKSGNEMVTVQLKDEETGFLDTVYLVTVQGKRWFLKNLLEACGVSASQDGIYEWDRRDIIGKKVYGEVVHEDNEFINRKGDTVKTIQHRIVKFEAVAWDE